MITVIEPHADDAMLSTHGHILGWLAAGESVRIVTVEDDPRRNEEAREYAKKVGADWSSFDGGIIPGQIVIPLGIKHADHKTVRTQFDRPGALFYLDMPYALVQRDNDEVNELLRDMQVVSFLRPHADKFRNIAIFKTQRSYFSQYGREEQIRRASFELIVRKVKP